MRQILALMGVTFDGTLNQHSDRNAVAELGGRDPRRHIQKVVFAYTLPQSQMSSLYSYENVDINDIKNYSIFLLEIFTRV